ncbi:MAG: SIS domain-containing protein [Nanoarchaeota archaeon]
MTKSEEIFLNSEHAIDFSKKYCNYITELLSNLDHVTISKIINLFLEAERNNKHIYFIGNGGSAAISTHFACDLGKGTKTQLNKFRTQALADNLSTFTAYANDHGYEHVFSKQLENVLERGDIVVCISSSGNSKNLITAVEYIKSVGAKSVSILGFDGGKLKEISDVSLVVNTPPGEYGPVESIHEIINHLVCSYIYFKLQNL